MNRLSRAIYYVPLRKINRHAHTFGIANNVLAFKRCYYASVGGATRHTVVVVSVSLSVATISRRSLKTNR